MRLQHDRPSLSVLGLVFFCFVAQATADEPAALAQRAAWTTSRVTGTPEPPAPYTVERVFPELTFDQPIEAITAPGSDRMFVAELLGKIYSFVPREGAEKQLVVDLKPAIAGLEQVYGLEFHPEFETNRYCYVCYVLKPDLPEGTRVSRFTLSNTDPPTLDPASEQRIITWPSGGHNGGCLKFGPDGYLYISTGDGTGPNPPDILRTGQDISDLLSSILRIDVDHPENDKPYRIPTDNPFVNTENARPEVWAYGLRNPWKMSFAPDTGDLLVGDVGWELWEMVYRVQPGGNYGWAVMEGRQDTNPEWPRGPTPILPPLVDHPHTEAASVTGGYVYRGQQLPALRGSYLYGDFQTGKLWSLRYAGDQVQALEELCDTTIQIICFAETKTGELYIVDHLGGFYQLVPNPSAGQRSDFPRRLSETGLFADTAAQTLAPGVIPYTIQAEPWADHAVAERWVALPDNSSIEVQGDKWVWPKDAVLAKTLSMDFERNNPASRRRLETQLLHFDGLEWRGYTYAWDEQQQDATLVAPAGEDRPLDISDASAEGGKVRQTWHFSSRSECARCHNPWSGPPLAFLPAQLDRSHTYGSLTTSQLAAFAQLGVLNQPANKPAAPLADPHDTSADLNARARAYLHTNCAHCHRMHAGSAVLSQMPYDLHLRETKMVGLRPTQGTFGIYAAEVVAAGDPYRSVLLCRMAKLGNGRMPYTGSQVIDLDGLALIEQWIEQLDGASANPEQPNQVEYAAATALRSEEQKLLEQLCAGLPAAEVSSLLGQLLERTSGALRLRRAIDEGRVPAEIRQTAIELARSHDQITVRDLFEPYVPEHLRVKRLGSVVDAAALLKLEGDIDRGRRVLLETAGVQCQNCHRIGEKGRAVGPDLTTIGTKYDRAQLLEQILEPSKKVDPQYVTYLAETTDGRLITGIVLQRTDTEVVLADTEGKPVTIAKDELEQLVPQRQSLMPELLLRDMTPQQVADLLAFLSSRR